MRTPTLGIITLSLACSLAQAQEAAKKTDPAPDFVEAAAWINSKPLSIGDLKGNVVVIHFWTFGCINCQRNLDAYNGWAKDFAGQPVKIIGIHTPEFDHEAQLDNIREHVKKWKIDYPIVVDNSKKIWQAWYNTLWPTVYLVDKTGRVRYRWQGELAWQGAKGDQGMRAKIKELLAEKPPTE